MKPLLAGDYSAWHGEVEDKTLIERKSVADLFTSFNGQSYEREKAKWTRAKEAGYTYIIAIEGSASDVRKGHTYWSGGQVQESKKSGLAQVRQLETISRKYNIPIWWCSSRKDMAFMIVEYFLAAERL